MSSVISLTPVGLVATLGIVFALQVGCAGKADTGDRGTEIGRTCLVGMAALKCSGIGPFVG